MVGRARYDLSYRDNLTGVFIQGDSEVSLEFSSWVPIPFEGGQTGDGRVRI